MRSIVIATMLLAVGLPSCARSMLEMRAELAGAHLEGELAPAVARLVHEEGQRAVIASTSYCARWPTLVFDGRLHQLFVFDEQTNKLSRTQVAGGHVWDLSAGALLRDGESFRRLRTHWGVGGIIVYAELEDGDEPQIAWWFPYFPDGQRGPRTTIPGDAGSIERFAARSLAPSG